MSARRKPSNGFLIQGLIGFLAVCLFIEAVAHTLRGASSPAAWAALPGPACYVAALWALSGVFHDTGKGEAFAPAMVRGLKRASLWLLLGAWCGVVLAPAVAQLQENDWTGLGGLHFDLSLQNLAVALAGLVLLLLARRGAELKAELEAFV